MIAARVGILVGDIEGKLLGDIEGIIVGREVGTNDGINVLGEEDGNDDGLALGKVDGIAVCDVVIDTVGDREGAAGDRVGVLLGIVRITIGGKVGITLGA